MDQDVEEAHAYSSCSSFVTPVSKRAKWAQETTDQNPRKLNYDSDDLTQRHSPDSSTPGSPVFFDLDDDDEQEVVVEKEAKSVTPRPTEETEKFDLSAGSPLIKSLRQLGSQMGQSQVTKDSQAERSHSPDDHYETSRDPSFVFGGPIPEGAELGFRTAANLPVHIPPNANYVDLFGDSQDTDDDELMKSISPPKSHLDPFQDSQMNDDLLQSVANCEFSSLSLYIILSGSEQSLPFFRTFSILSAEDQGASGSKVQWVRLCGRKHNVCALGRGS